MARARLVRLLAGIATAAVVTWGGQAVKAGDGATGGFRIQNDPPEAVFIIHPDADEQGGVSGVTPFTITINLCKTVDGDDGDELKYRYDFEGLGEFVRGRCRESHTYTKVGPEIAIATACVSDRQPDHETCQSWTINTVAGPPPGVGAFAARFSASLVLADVDGDGCADYVSVPWSTTGSIYVPSSQAQVFAPLADTDGDGKPDSVAFDLNGDGNMDADLQHSAPVAGKCSATTSPSRLLGPANPLLIDDGGDGPDGGDTSVIPIRSGNQITVNAPWDVSANGNNVFTLFGGSGVYEGVGRSTHYGASQTATVTGYSNGGASTFSIKESRRDGSTLNGEAMLLDTNGDGIMDYVEGYNQ